MKQSHSNTAASDDARRRAAVLAQIAKSGGGNHLESFAKIYADAINADDLLAQPAEFFAHCIMAAWQSVQSQSGQKSDIRAIFPDKKNSWLRSYSLISIVGVDMPFLVDSTSNALYAEGLEIEAVVHPTIYLEKSGKSITAVHPPRHLQKAKPMTGGSRVSVIQFIIKTPHADIPVNAVKARLHQVLDDVRSAVENWQVMRQKLASVMSELPAGIPTPSEREEARQFLEWLDQDHFTFLGYRAYDYPKTGSEGQIRVIPKTGLGVIADPDVRVFGDLRDRDSRNAELQDFIGDKSLISISKSNAISTVHRMVPWDVISIKRYNAKGAVIGEHRFVGLFTSLAYSRNPRDIPLLRKKVDNILARTGWSVNGHKAKILIDVLVSFPRDELIQIDEDELFTISMGITRIQEKLRTALFVRRDKFGRFYSVLIYTPRDSFTSDLRQKFADILQSHMGGKIRNFYTQLSDQMLARIHFIIDADGTERHSFDVLEIEKFLAEAARRWHDRLRENVLAAFGHGDGVGILRRYGSAFSDAFQNLFPMDDAIVDIRNIELLLAGKAASPDLGVHLYERGDADIGQCGLALYRLHQPLALSDILPTLENFGFRVISENSMPITPAHDGKPTTVWLHDLSICRADGLPIVPENLHAIFVDAMGGVRRGDFEDDGFNRLVVTNAIAAREIVVFRSYAKYLRQVGLTISQPAIERALAKHPSITGDLLRLFYAYFDPSKTATASAAMLAAKYQADILIKLDAITSVDEDRILRKYLNLIQSTLRTNFFQTRADGSPKNYFSVKLASPNIEDMPEPKPYCEIFICSPRVEAVHLRGGKVARGGIRWSDRREDFRTEILGLVKAQMVKNTVIVPVGSKGGFIVKQPPADKKLLSGEVTECYKTMMRGLLDITDNIKGGKIVRPQNVVCRDDDDPYLVVAADKGTAKFSDTANAVSAEYDFWLGDAFASGGSAGYDHKELAITARGGWISVERHFFESNVDIGKNAFSAIGVGDMAGDVFGNGMLRSKTMRLIAAFNHAHIFIDPNPDVAKSFAERQRLFDNPQLSWADYNAKIISKGGGVFARDAKKINLSNEAQAALGVTTQDFTPAQLVQAILKAPVDLLWLGGIGTFIKASRESHADVGDRANDALRIDAKDLRCKVIGEGANLGCTQLARIEYAMAGGRNNTDAIDNSGGVDCSDHEVNIKILLNAVEQDGRLTRPARNKLLKQMSDEVCELVLRDNHEQNLALSIMQADSVRTLDEYARHIRLLEKTAKLNRAIEFLPTDDDLSDRAINKRGLTRPELAVIMAYTKMGIYDALLSSRTPDDPAMAPDLIEYFPKPLQSKYAKDIHAHALRREIIATALTNYIVNRMGVKFIHTIAEVTGCPVADAVLAYATVRAVFGLDKTWRDIQSCGEKAPAAVQIHMIQALNRFIERATIWFLRGRKIRHGLSDCLKTYQQPIEKIHSTLHKILPKHDLAILDRKIADYKSNHVPHGLAAKIVNSRMLGGIGDVIDIANDLKKSPTDVAEIYFAIGERFGLDWMRRAISKGHSPSAWESRAVSSLIDDLLAIQARLTKSAVKASNGKTSSDPLASWLLGNRQPLATIDALLLEIQAAPVLDASMVTVAISKIRTLLA